MAIEPQTDREILVSLSKDMEQMKSTFAASIERLSDSIDRFGESLKELDEGKIMEISTRLKSIEDWKQQIVGAWKFIGVLWIVATAAAVYIAKLL